jgi:diaminohydroxyphosphoribosylaminopyrimidine deaminase / 5-amino-6-(5-phosphoribosylamino)uracil reductase
MNLTLDEQYMYRCIELARLGQGQVAPNPMVGSVLVFEDQIIGEGYHQQYGQPHAEVNCIASVKPEQKHLIEHSTIYVSLEPCAHFGKTPPCADLIIKNKIPKVVVGCRDPFELVAGKGIEKLQAAGIEVVSAVLEKECNELNKRFFTFHTQHRPYIILKWAQTADGKIAKPTPHPQPLKGSISAQNPVIDTSSKEIFNKADMRGGSSPLRAGGAAGGVAGRLFISNEYTNRLVHKWRSEEMSILVGTNTALMDDPELNTRLWPGNSPIRLVVDMDLRLPTSLKVFNRKYITIVFNTHKHTLPENNLFPTVSINSSTPLPLHYYQVTKDVNLVHQIVNALYHLKIQSVLVEGGAFLLQSFINENIWDEARVITNEQLYTRNGLPAPVLNNYQYLSKEYLFTDTIRTFLNANRS